MTHLIDKDMVAAEIEKMTDELYDLLPDASKVENGMITISEACNTGKYTALESFKDYIDTLEVKEEVNTTDAFIEKAEKWLNEHILDYVYAKEWGQGVGVEGELFDDFKNAMKGE